LTADLAREGYTDQTNVDFSDVVIDVMRRKYAALNSSWQVMDVRQMALPDGSFDIEIDKVDIPPEIHTRNIIDAER